ncbi:MAG: ubiquinone/menaquinone biosynthesis methyltransferase [Candidatus Omnitrophica bacterium]|nr:ubiquinone/menaquinone biosynthesis methyltransferase [Candidatus Omnitrophota bacterium]
MESLTSPEKGAIRKFFEGIAPRYDLINSLLSFRLDEAWRRRAADLILDGVQDKSRILDLGVGTGKFLEEFLGRKNWDLAVGVDFAWEMLERADEVVGEAPRFIQADIHDLPFGNRSFDLVISSFTLRSVKNIPHFLSEVSRVLKEKGRAGLLCLTRPSSPLMRTLYFPYLKVYLPLLGGFVSHDPKAYQFLSESIQTFPSPQEIAKELKIAGFSQVSIFPFSFGISTLTLAQK